MRRVRFFRELEANPKRTWKIMEEFFVAMLSIRFNIVCGRCLFESKMAALCNIVLYFITFTILALHRPCVLPEGHPLLCFLAKAMGMLLRYCQPKTSCSRHTKSFLHYALALKVYFIVQFFFTFIILLISFDRFWDCCCKYFCKDLLPFCLVHFHPGRF